jgi:hypothetical protein
MTAPGPPALTGPLMLAPFRELIHNIHQFGQSGEHWQWRCGVSYSTVDPGWVDGACRYDHVCGSWDELVQQGTAHLEKWHDIVPADAVPDVSRVRCDWCTGITSLDDEGMVVAHLRPDDGASCPGSHADDFERVAEQARPVPDTGHCRADHLAAGIRKFADDCKLLLDSDGLDNRVVRSIAQQERNLRALLAADSAPESSGYTDTRQASR